MNAQDVTSTYDCKVPGCTQEAKSNRGPFAYLCAEHRDRSTAARSGSTPVTNGATVEQRIKSLASLAREVDRAKDHARKLDERALDAKAVASTKEAEFQRIMREVLGGDARA